MSFLYLPKYNSYFIHIPKTGGTSIEFYFIRDHGIPIEMGKHVRVYKELHREFIIGRNFESHPVHHYDVREAARDFEFTKADYTFSIVRNPVERFKSECKFRRRTPVELLREKSYRTLPQYDYLHEKQELKVDEVFRFEEWEKMESRLSEVFNKKISLPHEQKSPDRKVVLTSAEEKEIRRKYARDYETFY